MTCYQMRTQIEKLKSEGKISSKQYEDMVRQMEEHKKLYHPPEKEEMKVKVLV